LKDKLSGIRTLKYRAEKYSSNALLLRAELNHLLKVFIENGYPEPLVKDILFSKAKQVGIQPMDLEQSDKKEFLGSLILPFVAELHNPVTTLCKRLGLKYLTKRKLNLGNLLSPRRPAQTALQKKNAIYCIPCSCNACYVGETCRKTETRGKEHQRTCVKALRMGRVQIDEKTDSGLPFHSLQNPGHSFQFQNTYVLQQESCWKKRKILEAIYIELTPNTVNLNGGWKFDSNWLSHLKFFSRYNKGRS
jgi:hypothetical protein